MIDNPPPIFVNTAEAARLLGLSTSTLEKMRHFRVADAPPVVRVGRAVRYPLDALHEWAASRVEGGRS